MDIKAILYGAGSGAVAAGVGYFKNAPKSGESWKPQKMLPEVFIGACLGAVAGGLNITYGEAKDKIPPEYLAMAAGAVVPFFDQTFSVLWDRLVGWLKARIASAGVSPLLPPPK